MVFIYAVIPRLRGEDIPSKQKFRYEVVPVADISLVGLFLFSPE